MEFDGKVVIVTGSTSGIGEQIALDFARNGANVVIHGRDEERMNSVVQRCQEESPSKRKSLGVTGDLRRDEDLRKIIDTTVATFGKIDILVNNAGIASIAAVDDPRFLAEFDNLLKINLRPMVVLSSLSIPYLIETKGCIVHISSCCAVKPTAGLLAIGAADAAKDMVTRSMALELGLRGCGPGCIKTPAHAALGIVFEEMELLNRQHLAKHGRPTDVSHCVLFLASPKSAFITGTLLQTDAGLNDG